MSKKHPVNVSVRPRGRNDTQQRMIKRFIRKCKKNKIMEKVRENIYYEKPSTKKRKAAKKRVRVLQKLLEEEKKREAGPTLAEAKKKNKKRNKR